MSRRNSRAAKRRKLERSIGDAVVGALASAVDSAAQSGGPVTEVFPCPCGCGEMGTVELQAVSSPDEVAELIKRDDPGGRPQMHWLVG